MRERWDGERWDGERWDGEKVHRRDGLAMVSEERQLTDFRQERSVVGPFSGLTCKAILEQTKTELPSNTVQLRHTGVTLGSGVL